MTDAEKLGITIVNHEPITDDDIWDKYGKDYWIETPKGKIINENAFARGFVELNALRYSNGLFYTVHGRATEDMISRDIWESIALAGMNTNVDATVKRLLGAVKLCATVPELKADERLIPYANGDLDLREMTFHHDRYASTPYRLTAEFHPNTIETPHFTKWLHDLFTDEDIPVVQEYLGYCLVPTTKAQKALFLVGEGGAGKSVLGVILESLLGDAVEATSNTQEFLQDKFKLPELEHKLVLYDDDLDNAALSETGLYKKLITNTISITADRKFGQPFKLRPMIKLVACCNEMLSSTYDQTGGFYRRLLPIKIKPIAKGFVPDPRFYDKIRKERDGIAQWALVGLLRLISNDYNLDISTRTKNFLQGKKEIGNHFPAFLSACFTLDNTATVPSTEILSVYKVWCRKNAADARKDRALLTWLADNSERIGIEMSNNIYVGTQRVRGFAGLAIKPEWKG